MLIAKSVITLDGLGVLFIWQHSSCHQIAVIKFENPEEVTEYQNNAESYLIENETEWTVIEEYHENTDMLFEDFEANCLYFREDKDPYSDLLELYFIFCNGMGDPDVLHQEYLEQIYYGA